MMEFQLRESIPVGRVRVFRNGAPTGKSFTDYTPAAQYLKYQFGLTDSELRTIYSDYREHYDSIP